MINLFIKISFTLVFSVLVNFSFSQDIKYITTENFNIQISEASLSNYSGTATGDNLLDFQGLDLKTILKSIVSPTNINFNKALDSRKYNIKVTSKNEISEYKLSIFNALCSNFGLVVKTKKEDVDAYKMLLLETNLLMNNSRNLTNNEGVKFRKTGGIIFLGEATLKELGDILTKETSNIYFYDGYLTNKYNYEISTSNINESLEKIGIGINKIVQKKLIYEVE